MISNEKIQEIREHLEKAQNPLFLFDNDADGLCSFLLLRRFLGRGKGFPVKTFPDLRVDYVRKVQELGADYIFILDKPVVSPEFFEEVRKFNIPVVWIDHHRIDQEIPDDVFYYNSLDDGIGEPVTEICYEISGNKDEWIAVIGNISDHFLPDYYSNFMKKYPELSVKTEDPFGVLFKSEIGKIAQMFNYGLKDKISNVIKMIKFLVEVKSPHEVFEKTDRNFELHEKFEEIYSKKKKLIAKAKKEFDEKNYLLFKYGGEIAMSAELANELSYLYPTKFIIIVFPNAGRLNLSFRGENVREGALKILEQIEDSTGGGHPCAVGGRIKENDYDLFKKLVEEEFG